MTTAERILQVCRFSTGAIWVYQGLVPKLLGPHRDELAMVAVLGVAPEHQAILSYAAGTFEVALGLCLLCLPRRAWPHVVAIAALAGLFGFVALFAPAFLFGAFNPVAMNVPLIALSLVALLALRERAGPGREI